MQKVKVRKSYIFMIFMIQHFICPSVVISQEEVIINISIKNYNGKKIDAPLDGKIYVHYLVQDSLKLLGGVYIQSDSTDRFLIKFYKPETTSNIISYRFSCDLLFYYQQSVSMQCDKLPYQISFYLNRYPECELERIRLSR